MVMPSWEHLALEVEITTWQICTDSVHTELGTGGPWEQLQSNNLSVDTHGAAKCYCKVQLIMLTLVAFISSLRVITTL